jgi:hypothetical protein
MSNYKKKVHLNKLGEASRNNGLEAGKRTQKENAINDGLTPTQRRTRKIREAANGCWWIEQYIIGTLSYARNLNGIDDE